MTIYTICTTQQKETWKLNSVNFASHLHVSPFFHHILSADSHFFLCAILSCRSHNSNGLIFCFFKCTVYWDFCSYCGCTREHLNLFFLPEILCPDQHLPSVFLSSANCPFSSSTHHLCFLSECGILQFHREVKSCSIGLPVPACLHLVSVSSPLLKWWYLLYGPWLHCVPTPHFLYLFIFWWTLRWFCVLLLLIKLQCAHSPAACLTGASFTHMPSSRWVTHSF